MADQAFQLRKLVRDRARRGTDPSSARPKWITVAGGKGGVGTTTVAVNLAVALAGRHGPTLLVDADPDRADAAGFCGIEPRVTIADLLGGVCSLEDALESGPGGIHFLAGLPTAGTPEGTEATLQQRLIEPLRDLGGPSEFLVVDGGNGSGTRTQQMWRAADLVLLLTTPDLPAILDAYASVKLLANPPPRGRICSLVNLAGDPPTASDVHGRLARACQRFLGIPVENAGYLVGDRSAAAAAERGRPILLSEEASPLAGQFLRLARTVAAIVSVGQCRRAAGGSLS